MWAGMKIVTFVFSCFCSWGHLCDRAGFDLVVLPLSFVHLSAVFWAWESRFTLCAFRAPKWPSPMEHVLAPVRILCLKFFL